MQSSHWKDRSIRKILEHYNFEFVFPFQIIGEEKLKPIRALSQVDARAFQNFQLLSKIYKSSLILSLILYIQILPARYICDCCYGFSQPDIFGRF